MFAQRDEFDKTSLDEFAHEITADVNVTRKNSAHWFLTHGNTGQIILIDFSCILRLLLINKIFVGFTKIKSLLPCLAGGDAGIRLRRYTKIHCLDIDFVQAIGPPLIIRM